MAGFRFHNLNISMAHIRAIGGGAPKYMGELVKQAMEQDVWPRWLKHISLTDHSLQDLANLDHPYANRYAIDSFAHPDEDVHIQSGDLVNKSRMEFEGGSDRFVARLINESEEYVYLRYGTSKMRMRDPAGATMREALPAIKKRFADGVKAAIIQYTTK
jgi:hypothetical protein